jgi:hypothetical protein
VVAAWDAAGPRVATIVAGRDELLALALQH